MGKISNTWSLMDAGLLGTAWTVASFLVIPILVVENERPITALTSSATLLKKAWGEQLIGNISFSFVYFLLGLPAIIPAVLGFIADTREGLIVGRSLSVIFLLVLALIQSALQAIFQAALYLSVRDGQVPQEFQAALLTNTITGHPIGKR